MRISDPNSQGISRCRAHTDVLVEELKLGVLWDDYGIVGDIVVTILLIIFPSLGSRFCNLKQPFTNDFPRADIHELLSPDLLHQVIKGVFKDHLVTWIEQYLLNTHGEAKGNEILSDIDRR